jgi:hypothetical protein
MLLDQIICTTGIIKRGRPKVKWVDGVDNDIKAPGERNWKNIARNREASGRIF